MEINGAVTLQINTYIIVAFVDGTPDIFFHIYSDKSIMLIDYEHETQQDIENHTNNIK